MKYAYKRDIKKKLVEIRNRYTIIKDDFKLETKFKHTKEQYGEFIAKINKTDQNFHEKIDLCKKAIETKLKLEEEYEKLYKETNNEGAYNLS